MRWEDLMRWKTHFFIGLTLICAGLLGFGFFLEHRLGLEPCPLCMLQRMAMAVLLCIGLAGALHRPERLGVCIYSALVFLAALAGGAVAAWQVRMQLLPEEEKTACGPGWVYMWDTYHFDAVRRAFTASGECGEVQWSFLGLSIPAWALLWFAMFCVAALLLFVAALRASARR